HWLFGRNRAHLTCARASLSVKYTCPEAGRETLQSSPSTTTTGKASSSRLRARALSWLGLRTVSRAGGSMRSGYRVTIRSLAGAGVAGHARPAHELGHSRPGNKPAGQD